MNEGSRKKTASSNASSGLVALGEGLSGNTLRPKDVVPLEVEYAGINGFLAEYLRHLRHGLGVFPLNKSIPQGAKFLFLLRAPKLGLALRVQGTVLQSEDDRVHVQLSFQNDDERLQLEHSVKQAMHREFGAALAESLLHAGGVSLHAPG